ncbi:Uncharacterized protein BM_BM3769 [Brugia malayi]|uniref:Bm3769 n=1 Tax=Brugia malayi TaxID=6279 RepID=A0A0I9N9W5_BRUMA|nr:Uncharacterized protein BM_BM3769 [Brugia malayi]CTP81453.1 Bm3769 [Brugia malayi]VIO97936.1 Uncharacterized protein BM_BM3769 [Brugia malayi]
MSNNSLTTTTRLRIKEPVYTSDKRAKFTQRESKKWIRFCTVIGYIFFVSLPATSLSIYYVWVWDPDYISRFPPDKNRTLKVDYAVKPMSSSVRQGSRSRYKLDLLRESNTSSRISKNLIRASVYPSFTKTTERYLEQRSHKMESSNTADQRLKMKPN